MGNIYIQRNPEDVKEAESKTDIIMNSTLHLLGSKNTFQIQF